MNPVRLLGKMTAKGVRLDGGGGGPVLIPASDVAAALGMGSLPRQVVLVGLAKYADDNQSQLALRDWVMARFRRRCVERGWKQNYVDGLALLVVYELVNPTRCPHCLGRGRRWLEVPVERGSDERVKRWTECGRCKGGGVVRLSERDRAAIAGITKSRFNETWAQRADELFAELVSLEDRVLRHLWRQFGEEAA